MTGKKAKKPKKKDGDEEITAKVKIFHSVIDGRSGFSITLPREALQFLFGNIISEEEKNDQGGEENGRDR